MTNSRKISSEILHINPWFSYEHDVFKHDDEGEGDYYYMNTKGAAMVIPLTEDGRILLVRQYRYLQDKNSTEFPCGGMVDGEVPSEAVKRELLEETGYEARELIKIGEFESNNGYCKDKTCLYVGLDLQQISNPQGEEGFIIETLLRRVDEFEDMIKNGEIWDGQTLASWCMARDYVKNLVK